MVGAGLAIGVVDTGDAVGLGRAAVGPGRVAVARGDAVAAFGAAEVRVGAAEPNWGPPESASATSAPVKAARMIVAA